MYSKFAFVMAWISLVMAALATAWWIRMVYFVEYNFLFEYFFTFCTLPFDAAVLLMVVFPSGVMYFRRGETRDRISLLLSTFSLLLVVVETVMLWTLITTHGA